MASIFSGFFAVRRIPIIFLFRKQAAKHSQLVRCKYFLPVFLNAFSHALFILLVKFYHFGNYNNIVICYKQLNY